MFEEAREEWVRQVREAGESLIKNAESIVGSERYLMGLDVRVDINANDEVPEIKVSRRFLPDAYIERVKGGDGR